MTRRRETAGGVGYKETSKERKDRLKAEREVNDMLVQESDEWFFSRRVRW